MTIPLELPAGDAAATPPESGGSDLASLAQRARDALCGRFAVAVASLRAAAAGLLSLAWVAGAYVTGSPSSWLAAGAAARGVGLVAALGVLAALARARRPSVPVLLAGTALDLAALAFGGWRALHAPAGLLGRALAVADVALLAAVLALALAQLAVRAPVEAQALRTLRAYGEGLAAQAERRERFRRELRETRARAEDLAELVVHDLKNPLAVVLSNVSVAFDAIARFPDLSEEREALHVAQVEAIRLSGMIGDLLVVPRLERGELHAQFSATRVWDLLDSVARATGLRAASRGLRLAVVAPPELVAWIDPLLVRRLLENLVGNALRHAPLGGRIELAASVEGERLRLAVRNDGAAVAAELRPRLFEKYAAHGEHDPRCSGLGLYLCRMVAELHGGRVGLVERAGWNVSFEAELPLTGRSERRDQPGATLTSRSA